MIFEPDFSTSGKTWEDYRDGERIWKHQSGYLKGFSLGKGKYNFRYHEFIKMRS
jgi:hypothetical protein